MRFGCYLRRLREARGLRQSDIASMIGVSSVYVCDIEKSKRNPLDIEKIRILSQEMTLTEKELEKLYDLAGDERGAIAPDIIDYLNRNPDAKKAIRRIVGQGIDYNWNTVPENRLER